VHAFRELLARYAIIRVEIECHETFEHRVAGFCSRRGRQFTLVEVEKNLSPPSVS
jgi:hypothetical protein